MVGINWGYQESKGKITQKQIGHEGDGWEDIVTLTKQLTTVLKYLMVFNVSAQIIQIFQA